MKSQKGVTLTSLAIYIVVVLIVLGILAVISGTFQGNIKEIYTEGTNNAEIDKLNVYLLREVKRQGNEISTISNNEVVFTTGNKYKFSSENQCVFLNNNIKIAENIEKCVFSTSTVNGKTVITLTIKAVNSEEKTIEYVLNSNTYNPSYEDESDYTSNIVIVDDQLAGTWVFNETILLDVEFSYGLNFTSADGYAFDKIESSQGFLIYDCESVTTYAPAYAYSAPDGYFAHKPYRTITITTTLAEMQNGEEFLTWLKANAVKQK